MTAISSRLEQMRNPIDTTPVLLSDLINTIYLKINNIVLSKTESQRRVIVQLKINMFEAALENHLLNRLIIDNPKVKYIGKNPSSDQSSTLILEVPEKFININSKRENSVTLLIH